MFGINKILSDYKEFKNFQSKSITPSIRVNEADNQLNRVLYQMLVNGNPSYYKVNQNTFIDKGYKFNPHVYTVIKFISDNISQINFYPYIIKDKKSYNHYLKNKALGNYGEAEIFKYKSLELVEKGGLADLLRQPNPSQSWSEFSKQWTGFEELTGNSYVYGTTPIGFADDFFAQLSIAPSQIMEIVRGDWETPVRGYKIQWTWGKYSEIPAGKILHQKNWNPTCDMDGPSPYGMSPLEPLLRTLKRSNQSLDGSLALLENGRPAGILSNNSDITLTPEEIAAGREALDKHFGGGKNLNRILQSSSKVDWVQIGLSSVDMELLASDKVDFATFARAYGIDYAIFDQDASTYNNKLQAKKAVWEDTLIPKLNHRRGGLNRWLTPAWSKRDGVEYFIDYDITGVPALQPDREKLVKIIDVAIKDGLLTRNEGRIMLCWDKVEGIAAMDEYELDLSKSNNPKIETSK